MDLLLKALEFSANIMSLSKRRGVGKQICRTKITLPVLKSPLLGTLSDSDYLTISMSLR